MGLWHLTCRWTCSNFQTKCEIAPFDLQMKGRSMKLMGCVQSAAAGSPVRNSLIACRVNQSKWRRAQTARSCCLVIDVASPDKGNSRKVKHNEDGAANVAVHFCLVTKSTSGRFKLNVAPKKMQSGPEVSRHLFFSMKWKYGWMMTTSTCSFTWQ